MKIHSLSPRHSRLQSGYTLIEALVAGVVLMIGISAASQMTLALITQEEINNRGATVQSCQENAARLYRLGFTDREIKALVPMEPAVSQLTVSPKSHDLGGGLGTMDCADVTVVYNPAPASEGWTAGLWSSGAAAQSRTNTIRVYRSPMPTEVP